MADRVVVAAEGPVRILRIQRPEVRNAVDAKTAKALREAWLAFDQDPEAKVAILTGGDEVFSAGADLADLEPLAADVERRRSRKGRGGRDGWIEAQRCRASWRRRAKPSRMLVSSSTCRPSRHRLR